MSRYPQRNCPDCAAPMRRLHWYDTGADGLGVMDAEDPDCPDAKPEDVVYQCEGKPEFHTYNLTELEFEVDFWSSMDGNTYFGYATRGHVCLAEFEHQVIREESPTYPARDQLTKPEHVYMKWHGPNGGWQYCAPDAKRAKPFTFWNSYDCGPWSHFDPTQPKGEVK